ncbi:hypothetical protein B0H13DRAFT_2037086, partial [Mycena leptocephala]
MHSRLVAALVLIGFYSYYVGIGDPDKAVPRVNEVDAWFKSEPFEWFSTTLAVWRCKNRRRCTVIGFEYNISVPSPVLDMTLNDPDMYGEYDFSLSFSTTATNYNPAPWNRRPISGSTDTSSCSDNVTVSVVDANSNAGNATGFESASYTIPDDAVFPL